MAPCSEPPSIRSSAANPNDYSPLASSRESQDEDEKLLHSGRATRKRSPWTRVCGWLRLPLEIMSLILLLANFVMLLNYSQPVTGPDARVSSGPANKHMTYGADPRYMSFDHKYDHLWNDAFSESWGAIALPPFKDTAGLYSKNPGRDEGGIGMYHAFHCVASMRRAFQKMHEGTVTLQELETGVHVAHCFDYLRKALLCMADDTFEIPRNHSGHPWGTIIEGQWDVRTCRDHTKLQNIMEKYGKWRRSESLVYHDEIGTVKNDPV